MEPRRRGRRTALWVVSAVGVVAALFVGVLATREPTRNVVAPSQLEGREAPPIEGASLLDGTPVRLSDLRDRYVVVNFFATWCVPCRREHPELVEFSARHAAAGDVAVVQVVFAERDLDRVREFFADNGGGWPVVDDPSGRVGLDYGVRGVPESFLVSPDGVVLVRFAGEVDADLLDATVREANAAGLGP